MNVCVDYELLPWLVLQVYTDGSVKTMDSSWIHPVHGGECKKEGSFLKFTDNWAWCKMCNMSVSSVWGLENVMWGKFSSASVMPVTLHSLVYAAFNGLGYWDEFSVGYLDVDGEVLLSNLYWMPWGKSGNVNDKSKAYKALELIVSGEMDVPESYKGLFFW